MSYFGFNSGSSGGSGGFGTSNTNSFGNTSGLGFGSTGNVNSGFGNTGNTGGFGVSNSNTVFGGTSGFGGNTGTSFGLGGNSGSTFGGTGNSFGNTGNNFSGNTSSSYGTNSFGSSGSGFNSGSSFNSGFSSGFSSGSGFGNSGSSAFGTTNTSNQFDLGSFGNSSGNTSIGFGGTTGTSWNSGNTSSGFGSSVSSNGFGTSFSLNTGSSLGGSSGGFLTSDNSFSSGFGGSGGKIPKFVPPEEIQSSPKGDKQMSKYMHISMMKEFQDKSPDEIAWAILSGQQGNLTSSGGIGFNSTFGNTLGGSSSGGGTTQPIISFGSDNSSFNFGGSSTFNSGGTTSGSSGSGFNFGSGGSTGGSGSNFSFGNDSGSGGMNFGGNSSGNNTSGGGGFNFGVSGGTSGNNTSGSGGFNFGGGSGNTNSGTGSNYSFGNDSSGGFNLGNTGNSSGGGFNFGSSGGGSSSGSGNTNSFSFGNNNSSNDSGFNFNAGGGSLFSGGTANFQIPKINSNPYGDNPLLEIKVEETREETEQPVVSISPLKSLQKSPLKIIPKSSKQMFYKEKLDLLNSNEMTKSKIQEPIIKPSIKKLHVDEKTFEGIVEKEQTSEKLNDLDKSLKTNDSLILENTGETFLKENDTIQKKGTIDPGLLPTLTKEKYYTVPPLKDLTNLIVHDFIVGHQDFGFVQFLGKTNLTQLNIDRIVHINEKSIEVYPESDSSLEKPDVGEERGLNKPSLVTLKKVYKKDGQKDDKFEEGLKRKLKKMNSLFLHYSKDLGELKFKVEHFSKYDFMDEEEEEEEEIPNKKFIEKTPGKIEKIENVSIIPKSGSESPEIHIEDDQENIEYLSELEKKNIMRETFFPSELPKPTPKKRINQIEKEEIKKPKSSFGYQEEFVDEEPKTNIYDIYKKPFHEKVFRFAPTENQQSFTPSCRIGFNIHSDLCAPSVTFKTEDPILPNMKITEHPKDSIDFKNLFETLLKNSTKSNDNIQLKLENQKFKETIKDFIDRIEFLGLSNQKKETFKSSFELLFALYEKPKENIIFDSETIKKRVGDWLKSTISREDIDHSNIDEFEKIFDFLTRGNTEKALEICSRAKNKYLSVLITQLGSNTNLTEELKKQIEYWNKKEARNNISNSLWKVYELLSGKTNVAKDLNWKKNFGLYLWYLPSLSLENVIKNYIKDYKKKEAAYPLPSYKKSPSDDIQDITFYILTLFAGETTFEKVLKNLNCYNDELDYSLTWLLSVLYTSCVNRLEEKTFFNLTINFAEQLIKEKKWEWSVFISLFIPNENERTTFIKGIITRNIGYLSKEIENFLNEIKIPREWVKEAKALIAFQENNKIESALLLLDTDPSKNYQKIHKRLIDGLAQTMIIEGKEEDLKKILEKLEKGKISLEDWNSNGFIFYEYLRLKDSYKQHEDFISKDNDIKILESSIQFKSLIQFEKKIVDFTKNINTLKGNEIAITLISDEITNILFKVHRILKEHNQSEIQNIENYILDLPLSDFTRLNQFHHLLFE